MKAQFHKALRRNTDHSVQAGGDVEWDGEEKAKFYAQVVDQDGLVAMGETDWVLPPAESWSCPVRTENGADLEAGFAVGYAIGVIAEDEGWEAYPWASLVKLP